MATKTTGYPLRDAIATWISNFSNMLKGEIITPETYAPWLAEEVKKCDQAAPRWKMGGMPRIPDPYAHTRGDSKLSLCAPPPTRTRRDGNTSSFRSMGRIISSSPPRQT